MADYLGRLAERFNSISGGGDTKVAPPDLGTRDIGGQFRDNQPYISGYFQTLFHFPKMLTEGGKDAGNMIKWLQSTVEGFTPHTQTLNKVDIVGQGQIGSSFVGSVTTTREFTLTFREYQNMPILNIIRAWTAVFDPFTGVSPLTGDKFIPSQYKGAVCVVQTRPTTAGKSPSINAEDIEEFYVYQGVFPTTIPVDTAGASDITGNDTVQLSATFSFDGAPLSSADMGPDGPGTVAKWFSDLDYNKTTFEEGYLAKAKAAFGK
jgi:hypothetical protein